MKVLICYDISDNKTRRKLVKYLEKFGVRIQYSVFLADITDRQIKVINAFADRLLYGKEDCKFYIYKGAETVSTQNERKLLEHFIIL